MKTGSFRSVRAAAVSGTARQRAGLLVPGPSLLSSCGVFPAATVLWPLWSSVCWWMCRLQQTAFQSLRCSNCCEDGILSSFFNIACKKQSAEAFCVTLNSGLRFLKEFEEIINWNFSEEWLWLLILQHQRQTLQSLEHLQVFKVVSESGYLFLSMSMCRFNLGLN